MKRQNAYWHDVRARLVDERGGVCEECGGGRSLEFCHVKPTELNGRGRGYNARAKDVRDRPDAYKLLCQVCHALLDARF